MNFSERLLLEAVYRHARKELAAGVRSQYPMAWLPARVKLSVAAPSNFHK